MNEKVEAILEVVGAIDQCAILKHTGQERWNMITPDVSGGWRVTRFDLGGFSGHSVFKTKEEAIVEAASFGYTISGKKTLIFMERDDRAIERLQDTPRFKRGNFLTELVGKFNVKQMTSEQMDVALAEYDRQHAAPSPSFTPFQYLPLFARISIERLDQDSTLRSTEKLDELLDAYATTYNLTCDAETRQSAHHICSSRFRESFDRGWAWERT